MSRTMHSGVPKRTWTPTNNPVFNQHIPANVPRNKMAAYGKRNVFVDIPICLEKGVSTGIQATEKPDAH